MSRLFGANGLKYTGEFFYNVHDMMSANVYADSDGMVFIMEERNCRMDNAFGRLQIDHQEEGPYDLHETIL